MRLFARYRVYEDVDVKPYREGPGMRDRYEAVRGETVDGSGREGVEPGELMAIFRIAVTWNCCEVWILHRHSMG